MLTTGVKFNPQWRAQILERLDQTLLELSMAVRIEAGQPDTDAGKRPQDS